MILVTGATGFLGQELLQQLISKNESIKALYRNERRIPAALKAHKNILWLAADINDIAAMEAALEGVSQVYHCAAMVAIDEKLKKQQFHVNIDGTANLVNLCLEIPNIKLLHVSSIAALGIPRANGLIDENCKWEFNKNASIYSISKYESELEVWRGITEGLNAVIVNPSLIIGNVNADHLSSNVIKMLEKGLPYFPKGGTGMVGVKDVAACMILLMESEIQQERFIISAENYTYERLIKELSKIKGYKTPKKIISKKGLTALYYLGKMLRFFTGKPLPFSKDLIHSSSSFQYLDNQKIKNTLHYTFTPIQKIIQEETFLN